jgi:hypothetical protein
MLQITNVLNYEVVNQIFADGVKASNYLAIRKDSLYRWGFWLYFLKPKMKKQVTSELIDLQTDKEKQSTLPARLLPVIIGMTPRWTNSKVIIRLRMLLQRTGGTIKNKICTGSKVQTGKV